MAGGSEEAAQGTSLAERICQGDRAAEEEFVDHYWRRVFAMALARTGDLEAARDLAQDVMLGVLSALRAGRLKNADSLSAFVRSTARNLVCVHLRERRRLSLVTPLPPDQPAAPARDDVEFSEQMTMLRRRLDRLGRIEQRILLLTLAEGLKPNEIAERTGLAVEVIRQRKSRALKKILQDGAGLSRNDRGRHKG